MVSHKAIEEKSDSYQFRGFQLAQLVKSLVVEQGTWVQIPFTPKTNWCLGLMVRATIMSGRHKFKCYHKNQLKKEEDSYQFGFPVVMAMNAYAWTAINDGTKIYTRSLNSFSCYLKM